MCHSVHGQGLHPGEGGSAWGGVCIQRVGQTPPPPPDTTGYGQRADGTHPIGMHSCSNVKSEKNYLYIRPQKDFNLRMAFN